MTIDGFVAGPNGELDWMWTSAQPDESMFGKIAELAETSDTILLGRKMTREFCDYWENVADNQPDSPEYSFAQQMVNMRKIVFSRTQKEIKGRNVEVENGDMVAAVKALKSQPGKDILVYGGADFVRSLINENLVDEYYIFTNPAAIGSGLSILKKKNSWNYKNQLLIRMVKY